MFDLAGRRFLITGAGRKLGAAFALVFADAGAELVLTGRDAAALEAVADAVARRGARRPQTAVLDLSRPLEAAEAARAIVRRVPGIDGLINNAAAWQTGRLAESEDAEIAAVIDSHVTGALLVTRALAPALRAAPAADIVDIVSTMALPWQPLYGASVAFSAGKHAQAAMTDGLRQEFAGSNVRVIGLYPPDLDSMTPLDDAWEASLRRGKNERVTSRDVVEAALFAVTRPRNCTLAAVVLDSDAGGIFPSTTPRHGERP